jgi:preprotein translocase subunit SecE
MVHALALWGQEIRHVTKLKENLIAKYLKETRAELQKVVWPSRKETTNLSLIVLAVMVVMSIGMGVIDFVFARLFSLIIG